MERLTYDFAVGGKHNWQVLGADNQVCEDVCKNQARAGDGCEKCPIGKAIDRLADYENAGMTPEEIITLKSIKSWADAVEHELDKITELEKAERLVVLPCAVTDTVYVLETVYKGKKQIGERVVSAQIDHVTIGGTTGEPVYDLCSETGNWYYSMEPGDFYLTVEEAEKAMKEGANRGV